MPSPDEELAKVQLSGVLAKRPVNLMNQSTGILASRWYKRFFVVKDGFLMYYPETEKREFERRKCANYHPKGLMPLGDCLITRMQEPDSPHMISIVNELSQERLVIQCENAWEQEKWVDSLERAARICWKNAQLGDTLIQQLQVQGARLAEEKQDAYMKLHDEVQALSDERCKTEEMERLMEAMEEEKSRLEQTSVQLHKEFEKVKAELEATVSAMKEVETEREKLAEQQTQLSSVLSNLELEKQETEQKLEQTRHKTGQLEEQNLQLSSEGEQAQSELAEQIIAERKLKLTLQANLQLIESKMNQVITDKVEAEEKVKEQAELAKLLQDEKMLFHEEAKELEKNLSDIKHQKDMTEAELKEEIKARLRAEEHLREAKKALENLEKRISEAETVVSEEHREQLMRNVKALKRYFEEKAIEQKIEADKPLIMKRAVYNKRRNLRAKSVMMLREDRGLITGIDEHEGVQTDLLSPASAVRVRNSANNVLQNKPLRSLIAQSVHGDINF